MDETTLKIVLEDGTAPDAKPVSPAAVPPPDQRPRPAAATDRFDFAPSAPTPSVPGLRPSPAVARPNDLLDEAFGRTADTTARLETAATAAAGELTALAGKLERFDFAPVPSREERDRLAPPAAVPAPADRPAGPTLPPADQRPRPAAAVERFDFAPAAPVPLAGGSGDGGKMPPPIDPASPFDFTPKGGTPFDFTPGALSPGGGKGGHKAFDFVDLRPAAVLPKAERVGAAAASAGGKAALGAAVPAVGEMLGAAKGAGPLLAVQLAADALAGGFKAARAGVHELGAAAREVASNDGIGLVTRAADHAADGLEQIPVVGKAAAEGVKLFTAGLREIDQTTRAFVARGRELAEFDPRLATAAAVADIRKLTGDMREADRAGELLSRLMDARSNLDAAVQNALTPLKSAVAGELADMNRKLTVIVDAGGAMLEVVAGSLPSLKGVTEAGFAMLGGIPLVGWTVRQMWEAMKKIAEKEQQKRERDEEELMNQIFQAADALGLPPANPNNVLADQQQAQVLGIPLLSR